MREPEVPKMMILNRLPHQHSAPLLELTLLLQVLHAPGLVLPQEDLLSLDIDIDKMMPMREPEVPKMMILNRLPHQHSAPLLELTLLLQVLHAPGLVLPQEDLPKHLATGLSNLL